MQAFVYDVRYAIRNLKGPRGVGICAILALAMGLAAATVMFSVVDAAIFRQVPFADAERVVMLYNTRFTARDGLARIASASALSRLLQGLIAGAGPWSARVLVLSLLATAMTAASR